MDTLWFCLVAFMLTMYVVFDGFDLGAGAVHLMVGRNERERRIVLRSIGPVWDGNEVWLLAAGGTLYFAFPALYASSFSGFYLPLMMVLWLLITRGMAIEFRNHVENELWKSFWDVTFAVSSTLLAVFLGAALGSVVRGVPLDDSGRFFAPLWTNFQPVGETGVLDWYTVLVGVMALCVLVVHGSLWVALKTDRPLLERARTIARRTWWLVLLLTIVVTAVTLTLQPQVLSNMNARPWGAAFPVVALGGLAAVRWFLSKESDRAAFLSSATYIVGMLLSAAFGVYPYLLPASTDVSHGLTAEQVAAPAYGLWVGLVWWTVGMVLVAIYFVYVYRRFRGKVRLEEAGY